MSANPSCVWPPSSVQTHSALRKAGRRPCRTTPAFDSRDLRDALGQFATGVTIITTMGPDGPLGLTVSSFAPVSLDPPLILWSLRNESMHKDAFLTSDAFAVHILGTEQRDLAMLFSKPVGDRFRNVDVAQGHAGVPVFDDCLVRFECSHEQAINAGDHTILIGRVQAIHTPAAQPDSALVFYRGKFGSQDSTPR